MPRAFDRKIPANDHDPLANLLDFGNLDQTAEIAGSMIRGYLNSLFAGIVNIIEDLTGIDLSSLTKLWDQLLDALFFWLPEDSGIGPGVLLAATTEESNILMRLLLGLAEGFASMLGINLLTMLSKGDPVNAQWLYNAIPTDLLAQISHSAIGEVVTNLVADPDFLDPLPVEGWPHDPTGGPDGTGCRSTTADGTTRELLTEDMIPVSQGQIMPIKGKAKWTGLVGTGNPIQLAVTGYSEDGSTITDQRTVIQHNTVPPTTDWVDMAGNYVVPANVAKIRPRLVVGSTATAGTVSFSKLSVTKVQTMFQRLIAGTDPGQTLTDDITNLFTGIISNTLEIIQKASQGDFDELLTALDPSGNLTAIEDRLNDFLHSLSPLNADNINQGNVADQFVPGLSTIHDAVVTAVGNVSGSGFDIGKVIEALTGQTHAVVDSSSSLVGIFTRLSQAEGKLAALPVSLGGTGVGISYGGVVGLVDTDDFERVGSNPGPLWTVSYQGGAGTVGTPNGHDLSFQTNGIDDRDFLMIRNNGAIPRSATDYQRVIQVVSAKSTRFYDALLGTYNYAGENFLWLRVSDDSTTLANVTGIRVGFGGDGNLTIVRFLAGAPTILKAFPPGTITPPGPGAILIGEAGDMNGGEAGKRYFRGIIGSSLRIDVTEDGVASGFGPAFRKWGTGGRAEGHLLPLPGQEKPGSLHYWTGMDQTL